MKPSIRLLATTLATVTCLFGGSALADTQASVAIRAGTLGLGADLDFSLTDHLNAPVGFAG